MIPQAGSDRRSSPGRREITRRPGRGARTCLGRAYLQQVHDKPVGERRARRADRRGVAREPPAPHPGRARGRLPPVPRHRGRRVRIVGTDGEPGDRYAEGGHRKTERPDHRSTDRPIFGAAPGSSVPSVDAGAAVEVRLASGAIGTYLVGRDGRNLYTFLHDSPGGSTCNLECAVTWPPFVLGAGRADHGRRRGDRAARPRHAGRRDEAGRVPGTPALHLQRRREDGRHDRPGQRLGLVRRATVRRPATRRPVRGPAVGGPKGNLSRGAARRA